MRTEIMEFSRTAFRTRTGILFDIKDPSPEAVHQADIISAMSKTCRYVGQIPRFYSVAEHSLYVLSLAEKLVASGRYPKRKLTRNLRLALLLHDAHEAYCGDISRPMGLVLKDLGVDVEPVRQRLDVAIAAHFGFEANAFKNPLVKFCDNQMLLVEQYHFWPDIYQQVVSPAYLWAASTPSFIPPSEISHQFLAKLHELLRAKQ